MPSHYIITYRVNYKKAIHRPSSKKPLLMLPSSGNTSHDKSFARSAAVGAQHFRADAARTERVRALKGFQMQPVKKKKHPLIVFAARPRGKTTSLCALTMPRPQREIMYTTIKCARTTGSIPFASLRTVCAAESERERERCTRAINADANRSQISAARI
jgi:hypothetical protein